MPATLGSRSLAAFALFAACAPSPHPSHALHVRERLPDGGIVVGDRDGAVLVPAKFAALLDGGVGMTDDLVDALCGSSDAETLELAVSTTRLLRTPTSLPLLERLAAASPPELCLGALLALGRIDGHDDGGRLHRTLDAQQTAGRMTRAEMLDVRYRCGDPTVLGELLELAKVDAEQQAPAIATLAQHAPLRAALGMEPRDPRPYDGATPWERLESLDYDPEFLAEPQFLRAAEEWYREQVLHRPSPWRPDVDFAWSEPDAAVKRAAFELLQREAHGPIAMGPMRVLPVDVARDAHDTEQPLSLCWGWMHANALHVCAYRPANGTIRVFAFGGARASPRSQFAADDLEVTYRYTEVSPQRYREMIVGMRTVLAARCIAWWQGPYVSFRSCTASFAARLHGLDFEGWPRKFHDFPRADAVATFLPLYVAVLLHLALFDGAEWKHAPLDAAARDAFVEIWQNDPDGWGRDASWWMREQFVGIAAGIADRRLVPQLLAFATRDSRDPSTRITAARACTALATCSGIDLRFDERGAPRDVAVVAGAYRDLLAR